MRKRSGFTILELTAVLLLTALLTGVVVASLNGAQRAAGLREAVAMLREADAEARGLARDTGEAAALKVDVVKQQLRTYPTADARRPMGTYRLPPRVKLRGCQLQGEAAHRLGSREQVLRFDAGGAGPTYGLALSVEGESDVYLVIAGVTGQFTEVKDEERMRSILAALPRGDAD